MDNSKKNFIWNMVGATAHAFTSLIFMVIVTRINGTDIAGIFTFAFSLACLLQVISNYSGRVYQVTETSSELKDSDFVFNRITSCIIMGLCAVIYLLFKDYDLYKNIIIFLFVLYRMIESFNDVMYGVIQKNDELYKVGISLFFKSIIGTILFFCIDYFTHNVIFSIVSLVVVNIVIMLFYDRNNFNKFYKKNFYNKSNNFKLFKLGIFVFGFTFLTQYILNAPKYAIDSSLTNDMQTIYGIISMPATFIVLCSQFIIQPLLVKFSKLIKNEEYDALFKLSIKVAFVVILIGIASSIAAYFLGVQVLKLIYGLDLKKYLIPLLIILCGATFYSVSFVLSNILTAMRKTFIQIIFYIIISIVIFFLSRYLVINYGIIGGTLSYAITMLILCIMYVLYYLFYMKKKLNS